MLYDEYPHTVIIRHLVEEKTDDSGQVEYDELGNPIYVEDELGNNVSSDWQVFDDNFECFIDTPSADEKYAAMQVNHRLDRFMYYPYRTDVLTGMRVEHEAVLYEVALKAEDQGGLNEIMRVALKEVDV